MGAPFSQVYALFQAGPMPDVRADVALERNESWHPVVASSLRLNVTVLQQFTQAMALLGQPIDLARMFLDSSYAYQHLAIAHSSHDEALRALSLKLFERYQMLESRRSGGMSDSLAH